MLVGFDTEYSFSQVRDIKGRLHADITTMQPVCACLYFEDGRELRFTGEWDRLQDLFDDPRYTFVVHGCHAEAMFCEAVGVRFPGRFVDTLLMGALVLHASTFRFEGGVYSHVGLAKMTARYGINLLAADDKDAIRESIMHGTHLQEYGMAQVLDYCMGDARATVQLYPRLRADLLRLAGPNAEKNLILLYQPYALAMAKAARRGIRFDMDGWGTLQEVAPRYRSRLLKTMQDAGYDHDGDGLGMRAFEKMIRGLGLEREWPRTPANHLRTREDDLKGLQHLHPAIEAAYKLGRFDSFFGQDFGGRVDSDGRLRCGILILAQHTGRNSTCKPNMMGMPGELRPLLLPDYGCVFIHFDFCQQEPGIAAWLSQDEGLMEDFSAKDVYVKLGVRMGLIRPEMSAPEVKSIRNRVLKSLMLAILYGKGAAAIARDVPCTYREAVMHLQTFSRTYSRLFAWLRHFVNIGLERGWAENIIGFRASFDVLSERERGHIARSCQNFPIQSSAAACFQLTGTYLDQFGADIRLPLHDAYLLNVPDDPKAIAEARGWVESATTTATNQLFPALAVKCDVEILNRFAKDGREDSFANWLASLEDQEARQCVLV